jgi:hypothetical protein
MVLITSAKARRFQAAGDSMRALSSRPEGEWLLTGRLWHEARRDAYAAYAGCRRNSGTCEQKITSICDRKPAAQMIRQAFAPYAPPTKAPTTPGASLSPRAGRG